MIRKILKKQDIKYIELMVQQSSFFTKEEVMIAKELAQESYKKGSKKSGYNFILHENNGVLSGFSCYGIIPCTKNSYDLYWIVVDKNLKNKGVGSILLKETELEVKKNNGKKLFAETSSTNLYTPTRNFYEKNKYVKVAELKDFYNENDNKVIYEKII